MLALLGDKNVMKDKNGNRHLDKDTGKITIKIIAFSSCSIKSETQNNRVHKV